MTILPKNSTRINSYFNFNHEGGELSSDCGILLAIDFNQRIDLLKRLGQINIPDDRKFYTYSNAQLMHQVILQLTAGYNTDAVANMLQVDPFFSELHDKIGFSSQASLSRLWKRFTPETLSSINDLSLDFFDLARQKMSLDTMIIDIDSTHCDTYGKQENTSFNAHYKTVGYHPIIAIDSLTGMVMNASQRSGNAYTSNGTVDFIRPLLERYAPSNAIILRGDSGFAAPEIYTCCEEYNTNYIIRLKRNNILIQMAETYAFEHATTLRTSEPESFYYFMNYQAKSWDEKRTVAVHSFKPEGRLFFNHEFVITNLSAFDSETIFKMYRNRGVMENYIKELKLGFFFDKTDSSSFVENSARMMMSTLAYNLFQMMKHLTFTKESSSFSIDTVRIRLFKVAGKIVKHARRTTLKLSSTHVYKELFNRISRNVLNIKMLT